MILDAEFLHSMAERLPDETPRPALRRAPVSVLYGGAHLFRADCIEKLGGMARAAFDAHAATALDLDTLLDLGLRSAKLRDRVHALVRTKLATAPIADLRIDFEDGYGERPDAEEDAHAVQAAERLAQAIEKGIAPPLAGIRPKALTRARAARSLRTLELFLQTLVARAGAIPAGFVVTLPKVSQVDQAEALASVLGKLERGLGLPEGAVACELMVETKAMLLAEDGTIGLSAFAQRLGPRLSGMHLGTYDLLSQLGVMAKDQDARHPAADLARLWMQFALSGTGVSLSDGATTVLPLPVHKTGSVPLDIAQVTENNRAVRAVLALHATNIRSALRLGITQGWDLHPAQLLARYAVVFAYFLGHLDEAARRLRNFVDAASHATSVGTTFDDAATAHGLLQFFRQGHAAGAFSDADLSGTSLTLEEILRGDFAGIVRSRRG
jgi:citrate lyase beta subunit